LRIAGARTLYVQIWSSPARETVLEVGADKLDVRRGAFIESVSEALRSRGFDMESNAGNFCEFLPIPRSKDSSPARWRSSPLGRAAVRSYGSSAGSNGHRGVTRARSSRCDPTDQSG
jgi:hypothetical protein